MEKIELRPHYNANVDLNNDEIIERIEQWVDESDGKVQYFRTNNHIRLEVAEADKHYWSPVLNIDIEKNDDESGCTLYGVSGPKQSVWLMFTFFYGFLIFGILVVALFGFSRRSLGASSSILYFLPVLIAAVIGMYATSKYGQKLAYDQLYLLRKLVKNAIIDKIKE